MSCIRLNVTDHDRTISGEVHGSIGDAVIAALSAEPETIHELELALARFNKPTGDSSALAWLRSGYNLEPYDAGIVIVDLAARVAAIDSTYSAPPEQIAEAPRPDLTDEILSEPWRAFLSDNDEQDSFDVKVPEAYLDQNRPPTYQIGYHDGEQLTDIHLPYRLPDDWLFVGSVLEYEWLGPERRAERAARESFDARAVLFGKPLSEFVARETLSAPNLDVENLFTEIHARWLVTPRSDLGGASPREILLAKTDLVDFDLHSRSLQWSFAGECPPPILVNSHAYRFAGFGTHEIVLYYELIRVLLSECRERARSVKQISLMDEIGRLEIIKEAWLEMPQEEGCGKAPALIIEYERKRIPLAMSGKEAMVDEDCPVCRAMAEDEGPYFYHLDGCNMDEGFEFSFFKTQEEWEAEERRREAFSQEWNARDAARRRELNTTLLAEEAEPF
jgi:hypothetical protein